MAVQGGDISRDKPPKSNIYTRLSLKLRTKVTTTECIANNTPDKPVPMGRHLFIYLFLLIKNYILIENVISISIKDDCYFNR